MSSRPLFFVNRSVVVAPRGNRWWHTFGAFALGCTVLACGGDKQTTGDTDATTGSEAQGTGENTTDAATTESTDATNGQTSDMSGSETAEQTTTDGPTTDDATKGSETDDPTKGETETETDDPTKGETETGGEDALKESCQHACEAFFECDPESDLEECVTDCIDIFEEQSKDCIEAVIAANKCFAMLSCDEMDPEEPPFPCEAEEMHVEEVCGTGEECSVGVGMGMGNEQCEVVLECAFDSYGMLCNGNMCTCNMNGEKVGMCENPGYCGQIGEGEPTDLLVECCGFDL